MAIFLATIALCVAVAALLRNPPRTLRLDKLELVNGGDRTMIEPGRIEIERVGFSAIGLSVLNGAPYIIGNTVQANFQLHAGEDSAALLLRDGADLASILPNGATIQNATTKSTLLATCLMPGLPLHAGHEQPATIVAQSVKVEPTKPLARLRMNHGLKIHHDVDESELQPA